MSSSVWLGLCTCMYVYMYVCMMVSCVFVKMTCTLVIAWVINGHAKTKEV